jgi:uncharacterized delta-60 repeat protein
MKKIYNAFAILSLVCTHQLNAQAGLPDMSFSGDGKVVTPLGAANDKANAVAIQADGKIVVAGWSVNYTPNTNVDIAVVRYNTDGTLDNTWGGTGIVTTDVGGFDRALAVVIQPDGKILVGGYSDGSTTNDFCVVRYNTDGTLDLGFDTDGIVVNDLGIGADDQVYAMALQSDGKIVVTGYTNAVNFADIALMRYNTNGSVDNTFDTDGIVILSTAGSEEYPTGLAIQSDGNIVVVGKRSISNTSDILLLRFTTTGAADNTFGTNGEVVTDLGTASDIGSDIVLQGDGKLVVAGASQNGSGYDFALVRYNTNGTLDNTFDTDGVALASLSAQDDIGYGIALQSDGKLVVAGSANADFAVARFNTNGSIDNTFNTNGFTTTDMGAATVDFAYDVALQSDGNIVIAGAVDSSSYNDFGVARYLGSGASLVQSVSAPPLQLFPNPCAGPVMLRGTHTGEIIEVFDLRGNLVLSQEAAEHQTTIPTATLAAGYYMLQYKGQERFRLCKQN